MGIKRTSQGGAIAETGPALLLLLILAVFPFMDLLYIGSSFGFAWFLHSAEIRELTVRNWLNSDGTPNFTQAQTFLGKADTDFLSNAAGFAGFLGINSSNASTKVSHVNPTYNPPTAEDPNGSVMLTTTVIIRPWLYIPFFVSVPGISADMSFTFTSVKPQEENGKN